MPTLFKYFTNKNGQKSLCVPSIVHLWACVDGLIHSLLCTSWSYGSCIWLLTAMLRFTCPQISITVNVKCHCQWNPANQLPRTTGNIGRSWCKSSSEAWFGPGLNNKFMVMSIQQQKIELWNLFVGATYITFTWVWAGLCFCTTPVLLLFFLFTSTVQKWQALGQYTLN